MALALLAPRHPALAAQVRLAMETSQEQLRQGMADIASLDGHLNDLRGKVSHVT